MIFASPKKLEIGSIVRYDEDKCLGLLDAHGNFHTMFACKVIRECTREEYFQELVSLPDVRPDQIVFTMDFVDTHGSRFYEVQVD